MKLVRSVRLWFKEGTSDKLYEVDLVENDALPSDNRFIVNFRFGRRGSTLRDGSKTINPVTAEAAEKIFDSVVVAKVNEGYRRTDQPAGVAGQPSRPAVAATAAPADVLDGRARELIARLEACVRSPWPSRDLDRLVWRIGQLKLRAAGPLLVDLAARIGPAEVSYSLVWALSRAGQERAASILAEIARSTRSAVTHDLARFALVSPLMGEARVLEAGDGDVPDAVSRAAVDPAALVQALTDLGAREPVRVGGAMVALGRRAQGDPARHAALIAALRALPARPPFLIGLRRLFKHAEMADDAALFAVTARAFETARPMYNRPNYSSARPWIPELGFSVKLSEVVGRPDAKIGLSNVTLAYLKRRIWRSLRKRAEVGDPAFAELAAAYLLALKPGDMAPPTTKTLWKRNAEGRWTQEQRTTGGLNRNWTASQLLRRNDPLAQARYGSLTFNEKPAGSTAATPRPEAFAALWDARPDLALDLAADGAVAPVSGLGVRVLSANPDYLRAVDAAALKRLLRAADIAAQRLGFSEARDRLASGSADPALLAALLSADFPEARRLAVARIERDPPLPWTDGALGLTALTSSHEDLAQTILTWARDRRAGAAGADIADHLADWFLTIAPEPEEATLALLRTVRERMAALWAANDMPLAPAKIDALLVHPSPAIVAAGIDCLALSGADVSSISNERWSQLLGSTSTDVQTAALRLFGRLDDAALGRHAELVVAFATASSSELRRAARPLVARLAARDTALADRLAKELIDQLFRTAPDDLWPGDVVTLLREATPAQVSALDAGTLWRLLQARAKGAQLLGSTELPDRPFSTFSVRQTARLGSHPHEAARRWALSAYSADPSRFQREAEDAVLLVESDWEDAQEFAREHFDTWPEHAWTPATLAVVTDSVKPEVLAFARRLLRSRLSPSDSAAQLTRLLEHPAQSMHLLVTELLTEDAAASDEAFEKLLPLARIVMLQVHKGRIAKDRMTAFLLREALRDRSRAERIAPLFSDLSISGVARDRSAAILALRDIAAAHPGVETPLNRRAAPVRAA